MEDIIFVVDVMVLGFTEAIFGFCNVITEDPLLLSFVCLSFCGLAIGLIRRIIR